MRSDAERFESSAEQIAAELAWLELVIKREIVAVRRGRAHKEKFDEFSGLYVSEQDIDDYLAESVQNEPHLSRDPEVSRLTDAIQGVRRRLDQDAAEALAAGVDLRLSRLTQEFALEPDEVTVLLACLAPDVDLRFQKYFAYLQNDVSKRRPTVQLLHRFGRVDSGPPLGARSTFGAEGKLLACGLLALPAHKPDDCFPLQQPRLPEAVTDFLAGVDRVDAASTGVVIHSRPQQLAEPSAYFDRHRELLRDWLDDREGLVGCPVVLLGPTGAGRADLVGAFAAAAGRTVLTVDASMLATRPEDITVQLSCLVRDARMLRAVVHVADIDELCVDDGVAQDRASSLGRALSRGAIEFLFLSSKDRVPEIERRLARPGRVSELRLPSIDERTELWQSTLSSPLREREPDLAGDLATRFKFAPAKVRAAALRAKSTGSRDGGNGDGGGLCGDDYFGACRMESNQNLRKFGKKMVPSYKWEDLVLPPDTWNQLQEICACVRHKQQIFEGWGFGEKFSLGRGLNVLFAGASGTGKTMCAEIIAGDLSLDAFKIDLSCVVSKYVGETERNLSRIFDEAETSNSILFFDEADALFGKRSEVKDAHDRYANIEINYLLQKMDDYEGIVILATNLRGNLDKAFTRRLNYLVEFPFPDEHSRERIWTQIFPGAMPLGSDVKFDFLARKFKLAGGSIKNIAVNSAFLAAGNGGSVDMEHVILATKREYQKLGRICSKSDFGPYFKLLQELPS